MTKREKAMNSPEREEVSKPSRADLYREALDQSTRMAQEILRLRKELAEKSDPLISREMRVRELQAAIRELWPWFAKGAACLPKTCAVLTFKIPTTPGDWD